MIQLESLFKEFSKLHVTHGDTGLTPIYGAGEISSPKMAFIFMNPTDKNVSAHPSWGGIRAPWLGTKNVWRLFYKLGLFSNTEIFEQIQKLKPSEWTPEFAKSVYLAVKNDNFYITNISKATTYGAVPVSSAVYKEFLSLLLQELELVNPKYVFTLGNQVSSVLLQRSISVSNYLEGEFEEIELPSRGKLKVYPAYYPVGQGQRNMPLMVEQLKRVVG